MNCQTESAPALECDLVMKGGVTSGIIYPAAVAAIAEHYRLRAVGGTSAGAIGAAAAAAMEFGRRSKRNPAATAMMADLAVQLGKPVDGSPLLLRLFEPDPSTARLFRLILRLASAPEGKTPATIFGIFLGAPLWIALGISAVLVALLSWAATNPVTGLHVATMVLLLLGLWPTLTLGLALWRWLPRLQADLQAVAQNGFGFCSGMATYRSTAGTWRWPWTRRAAPVEAPSLSAWLHQQFQALAGLAEEEPLTFGDLWAAQCRTGERDRDQAFALAVQACEPEGSAAGVANNDATVDATADATQPRVTLDRIPRAVDLALVASDINRAQSVQFPFMRRDDRLYVRISDLALLFPATVVAWMTAKARKGPEIADELGRLVPDPAERSDYIRLPPPQDLPILFGVRASLSFPFLFRAVRLYVVRPMDDGSGRHQLDEIWLADGGITSNFPIHLFDAPLPGRPTFCLNLLYHDDEFAPESAPDSGSAEEGAGSPRDTGLRMSDKDTDGSSVDELIYMLRSNKGRLSAYTRLQQGSPLQRLVRFGGRIITTARQWGDNQLIDVPGYRDRIVHIRMLPKEGGFNFNMGEDRIEALQRRGYRAGDVIAKRFLPDTTQDPLHPGEELQLNWANHRFVRYRAFLAGLEVTAARFTDSWERDRQRAELVPDDPRHTVPSMEQATEDIRAGNNPFAQKVGYPFRSNAQGNLALDMVKLLQQMHALADNPAWRGIDYVNGKGSSPRPKSLLKLRPPVDTDPASDFPAG